MHNACKSKTLSGHTGQFCLSFLLAAAHLFPLYLATPMFAVEIWHCVHCIMTMWNCTYRTIMYSVVIDEIVYVKIQTESHGPPKIG